MNGEPTQFEPELELEDPFLGDIIGGLFGETEAEYEDPFLGDILGGLFGETEAEYEDPFLGDILGGLFGETEAEYEEPFLGDILPGVGDILGGLMGEAEEMELLAEAATQAESEAEAEGFIGALVPLAAKFLPKLLPIAKNLLPKALSAARRVTPNLIKNVTRLGRKMRKHPRTRPLVRTLPTIVRNTVKTVGKAAAAGKPVTPAAAVKTMAHHAQRILRSPARRRACIVRTPRLAHRCRCKNHIHFTIS